MTINLSPTAIIDLIVKKQDRINFDFVVTDENDSPVNFSGYTAAKMAVRANELSSDSIVTFHSTGTTYQIDMTGKASGAFTVSCDSINVDNGDYYYDFQLNNATQIETVMTGKFTVTYQITS